jgi:cystathionine gamma-synthase
LYGVHMSIGDRIVTATNYAAEAADATNLASASASLSFDARATMIGHSDEFASMVGIPLIKDSTNIFSSTADLIACQEGRGVAGVTDYNRQSNRVAVAAERGIANLMSADWSLLFSSGMNAINAVYAATLRSGDHVAVGDNSYRRTKKLLKETYQKFGVESSVVPLGDLDKLQEGLRPNTKLLVIETPSNPHLRVVDIERVVEIAQSRGILTVFDSTIATPYNLRPLEWGADLVIESGTKYLAGNHDSFMGVVAGRGAWKEEIYNVRANGVGALPSAESTHDLIKSLHTLALRMRAHNQDALLVAEFLESHPAVENVWYPLLKSHPDYDLACKYLAGGGGLISFTVAGGFEQASQVVDRVGDPRKSDYSIGIAASFGGHRSFIEMPRVMSYWNVAEEVRKEAGITDNLIRFAVGLEGSDYIINQLKYGLDSLR